MEKFMNPQSVFERSTCFAYKTRVFSVLRDAGTKTTTATRKQKDIQEVIHPSRIKTLGKLKQEAFRLCRSMGTKLDMLDLWIVPNDDSDALSDGLLDINARWDTWTNDTLFPNYSDWVSNYAKENEVDAADILRLAPSIDEIKKSTRFVFANFSLRDANVRSINIEQEVEGLWGQVLSEIVSDIKDAHMDTSQTFTQGARDVLKRIARKCDGLGFLHPRLEEISNTIRTVLAALPTSGAIKGIDALAVKQVLDTLMNPNKFAQQGFVAFDSSPDPSSDETADSDAADDAQEATASEVDSLADESPADVPSLDDIFSSVPKGEPVQEPQEALVETDFNGW